MVKVSFNLPDSVYEALRKKAYEEHVAMTDIIIGALAEQSLKKSVVLPVIKRNPMNEGKPVKTFIPEVWEGGLNSKAGEMDADNYV
jgi:hypothetical protein